MPQSEIGNAQRVPESNRVVRLHRRHRVCSGVKLATLSRISKRFLGKLHAVWFSADSISLGLCSASEAHLVGTSWHQAFRLSIDPEPGKAKDLRQPTAPPTCNGRAPRFHAPLLQNFCRLWKRFWNRTMLQTPPKQQHHLGPLSMVMGVDHWDRLVRKLSGRRDLRLPNLQVVAQLSLSMSWPPISAPPCLDTERPLNASCWSLAGQNSKAVTLSISRKSE